MVRFALICIAPFIFCDCGLMMDEINTEPASADTITDTSSGSNTSDASETDLGTETETNADPETDVETETTTDKEEECLGVICYEPLKPTCSSRKGFLVTRNPAGYCQQGQCKYLTREALCDSGECSDGVCVDTPCQRKNCVTPPKPRCSIDHSELIIYAPVGHCNTGGECVYSPKKINCPSCDNGVCTDNPCLGVLCNKPPSRYCEGDTIVVSEPFGACSEDGKCVYVSHQVDCMGKCEDGLCAENQCEAVSCAFPPASYCIDQNTLRTFEPSGICDKGSCVYQHVDKPCANSNQCVDGVCTEDSCLGVSCYFRPTPFCPDGEHLTKWTGEVGSCTDGFCEFPTGSINCVSGCSEGTCGTDLSEYLICTSPPADHCHGKYVVEYEPMGSPSASTPGACVYESHRSPCPETCSLAACVSAQ